MVSLVRTAYLSTILFRSSFLRCSRRSALTTISSSFFAASSLSNRAAAANTPASCTTTTKQTMSSVDTGYLNAADAASLDGELMQTPGFTLEQLMELAGLSVAEAVYQVLSDQVESTAEKILVVCGPGNNGGDGLVAARHLAMFGYNVEVVYPKQSSKQPHYANLVKQCQDLKIPVLTEMPPLTEFTAIIDAIFGFSFRGDPRPPFDKILDQLRETEATTFAVDIPSGWDVNGSGDTDFVPDVLISLTAPKLCAKKFPGRHFVGGRFLPPALASKYNVRMPPYPGVAQVMEVSTGIGNKLKTEDNWGAGYAQFLAEKEGKEFARYQSKENEESEDTWELQYATYCAAKEAALNEEEQRMYAAAGEGD